ncbi:MAG: FAD-binding protein, partial [Actinobacteria bacterium]|nr:FAD-binding protein [Actinomycetota bacterium]
MSVAAAVEELRHRLGDKVTTNDTVREHHSRDESFHLPVMPDAVVWAECTEDVVAVVTVCNEHRVPLVPFGVGTSLEANSTPIHGGISLDMSRMDKV